MFKKIYEFIVSLFSKAFISVVCEYDSCVVKIKVIKNKELKESDTKSFKAFSQEIPPDALRYIKKYVDEYRFCYISTQMVSINQGAIPTCKKDDFSKFNISPQNIYSLCVDNKWSIYAYNDDIKRVENNYLQVGGVDFLFSPFAIIYFLVKKEPLSDKKLYALVQKSAITLAIMEKDILNYGAYFILAPTESLKAEETLEQIELPESLTAEIEELTPLDNIDNIGKLESLDVELKMDEFEDTSSEHVHENIDYERANASIEEFSKGMDMLNFIKESLNDFYKNSNYDAVFIDEIIFFDAFGIGNDIIDYIQSTLLMSVVHKKIDLAEIICDMAIAEFESK